MKRELKQALIATKATLLVLMPVSAYAATLTFGQQLVQNQMLDILMTLLLSTGMGATALVNAMAEEYRANKGEAIPRLGLFIASRMLSSNAAGLLMYFVQQSLGINTDYRAGYIMLAAFGGNWFIQRLLQFVANKYIPEASK